MDASAEVVGSRRPRSRPNLTFATGDVYAIDAADDTYDVVHAHQVLQHLADPVAALREMRRVCRPGGVVAARDADYRGMSWYPRAAGDGRWLELYRRSPARNGGEPDAGRLLLAWAHAAGFADVTASATCLVLRRHRRPRSGGPTCGPTASPSRACRPGSERGIATAPELPDRRGLARWASDPDAWFAVLHGEILANRLTVGVGPRCSGAQSVAGTTLEHPDSCSRSTTDPRSGAHRRSGGQPTVDARQRPRRGTCFRLRGCHRTANRPPHP